MYFTSLCFENSVVAGEFRASLPNGEVETQRGERTHPESRLLGWAGLGLEPGAVWKCFHVY